MIDFIPAPASLPPGQRVYAIGDVHGCLDRLQAHARADRRGPGRAAGRRSRCWCTSATTSIAARTAPAWWRGWPPASPLPDVPTVNLMGNHEHMMLAAVATGETEATELWLANGGADSLLSWGVPRSAQPKEWPAYLPMPHLMFLRDLAVRHAAGGYLFVHAGIRPGIPLERQSRHDLMWIREPFLSSKEPFGAVVVHGHTPRQEPVVRPNRIGIDTGAVMGGVLTCVVLEEDRLGFITA